LPPSHVVGALHSPPPLPLLRMMSAKRVGVQGSRAPTKNNVMQEI
jgi:hypothetical protein